MPSFQAKIGWKTPRKREYKKYRSVSFLPDAKQKIPKNSKKIKKVKKFYYGFISSLKQVGKSREIEKIKIIGPFRSYTTRYRKFQ